MSAGRLRILGALPAFLSLWMAASPVFADDPPAVDERSYSRYGATRAYQQGGELQRNAFEAERTMPPQAAANAVEFFPGGVHIRLEVHEIQEEVYPGKFVTFWVFAPIGGAFSAAGRAPSPTIRVEEGERVLITLYNTHYLPHTIHLHGLSQSAAMDGMGDMGTDVLPGDSFTYEFVAKIPGTYFYHCHVQEHVHMSMGLVGMLIIEPKRTENHFARLVPGAGRIQSMGKGTSENYAGEYSLVFSDADTRMNRIPALTGDVNLIERHMHREFDVSQARPNLFLLNGRSFPYTLQDTPIMVRSGERYLFRVLNAGSRPISLHTHGHHPTIVGIDGYPAPPAARVARDTFAISPGQRLDLDLKAGADGVDAAGPGMWMVQDHTLGASTNNGIGPGGSQTMIIYEDRPAGAAPMTHDISRLMDPEYYRGRQPLFGTATSASEASAPAFVPVRPEEAEVPSLEKLDIARHMPIAQSCGKKPGRTRTVTIRAGRKYAQQGESFGFSPREVALEKCETVELTLVNEDNIRHDLMIPGLRPMFAANVVGPGTTTLSFVTPDADITLPFHCHVPSHDKVGMLGNFVIGKGGQVAVPLSQPEAPKRVEGTGVVIATLPRSNRLVVNHEAIEGFMPAMEMSYAVETPALLEGLKEGDLIRFVIDPQALKIISITRGR